jgi:hypothetical protein
LPIDALLAIMRPISLRFPVGLALYLANNGFLIPHAMLERIHDQHSEFISVFAQDYGRISADKFVISMIALLKNGREHVWSLKRQWRKNA